MRDKKTVEGYGIRIQLTYQHLLYLTSKCLREEGVLAALCMDEDVGWNESELRRHIFTLILLHAIRFRHKFA